MRWAAARVGTGAPACYFHEVAQAAADEIEAHKGKLSASDMAVIWFLRFLLGDNSLIIAH